jgi:hypothetical protein
MTFQRPPTGRGVQNRKRLVTEAHKLDAARLRRAGFFARSGVLWTSTWSGRWPHTSTSQVFCWLVADAGGPREILLIHREPDRRDRLVSYPVLLDTTVPHFGGRRWWLRCPLGIDGQPCLRRVRILYRPPGAPGFGCRLCYRLGYESQRKSGDSFYRLYEKPLRTIPDLYQDLSCRSPRRRLRALRQAEMLLPDAEKAPA